MWKGDEDKMKQWKLISEYAKEQGKTVQAIHYRIKQGHIPESRIRKGDSGKIEIQER